MFKSVPVFLSAMLREIFLKTVLSRIKPEYCVFLKNRASPHTCVLNWAEEGGSETTEACERAFEDYEAISTLLFALRTNEMRCEQFTEVKKVFET